MSSVDTFAALSVDTIRRVPNQPKTPGHNIRVPDDDWADLADAAAEMGTDRSKLINQLVRWYLRRPGAKLPERPPAADR